MARYEDDTVLIDDDGVLIKHYWWRGRARHVEHQSIRRVDAVELGPLTGRYQLVGIPLARPRSWFAWERGRRHKRQALVVDLGRILRPALTPDDVDAALAALADYR